MGRYKHTKIKFVTLTKYHNIKKQILILGNTLLLSPERCQSGSCYGCAFWLTIKLVVIYFNNRLSTLYIARRVMKNVTLTFYPTYLI